MTNATAMAATAEPSESIESSTETRGVKRSKNPKKKMNSKKTNKSEAKMDSRRLNLVLDGVSFSKLKKIKDKHGDPTYTQAIKRAIALLEFIDQKKAEGSELYFTEKDSDTLKTFIMGP
jgi:hypothetical protein